MSNKRKATGPSGVQQQAPERTRRDPEQLPPGVTPQDDEKRLLSRITLRKLVTQTLKVDLVPPEVEELLLDVGDDFLEHVAAGAAALARHRGSDTLDAEDVRLHCERVWGIPLPGHVEVKAQPLEAKQPSASHNARLAAIRRTLVTAAQAGALKQQ